MRVRDLMTREVFTCERDTDLACAGARMWEGDCGALVVVEGPGKAVGMITDRDICIAVATRDKLASEIRVGDVISGKVHSCGPDDDPREALRIMQERRVRRLPVVDAGGILQGILTLNDVATAVPEAKPAKEGPLGPWDVARTLKSICGHRFVGRVMGAA